MLPNETTTFLFLTKPFKKYGHIIVSGKGIDRVIIHLKKVHIVNC